MVNPGWEYLKDKTDSKKVDECFWYEYKELEGDINDVVPEKPQGSFIPARGRCPRVNAVDQGLAYLKEKFYQHKKKQLNQDNNTPSEWKYTGCTMEYLLPSQVPGVVGLAWTTW